MGEGQNIIACFYDCDQTLTPEYMQDPMLRHFGVDPAEFWKDNHKLKVEAKTAGVDINPENAYMINLLLYIKKGKLPPLSNADLQRYGKEFITSYPGLPDFFLRTKEEIKNRYSQYGIKLEHYIISTGLRKMIQGSSLNSPGALDQIFASEFMEYQGVIRWPARNVGFIEKTRYLYEANKGVNVDPSIDVNKRMPADQRRIYFENMIYVGDGFTDVPCMALTIERGGTSIGVYDPHNPKAKREAEGLLQDGRISKIAQTDYRKGREASEAVEESIIHAAERILRRNSKI
ncbi:MAG: haloacid dehalogenase-like hydrolase [Nanoarchaeota archaeon]|nr:haloacid dehalogenase-like hydrolase [Nanoarchaeota archaeon]